MVTPQIVPVTVLLFWVVGRNIMESAVFAFIIDGNPVVCKAFGHGHINSTFKITTDTGDIIISIK